MSSLKNFFRNLMVVIFLFNSSLTIFSSLASSELINGAGASFPYPLYSLWFKTYAAKNPDVKINYQSIGSGGGVRQIIQGTVDFGASDSPMKDEELKESKSKITHIPTVLGAVALTYNLAGFKDELKLTADLIVDIYSGVIKTWNDPKLVALNPGLSHFKNYIIPIRRADGSGTTAVFTEYLSKVSPIWKSKFGSGKSIKWSVGLGGKGNEGVTGLLKQNPGSIGYVEVTFAQTSGLPTASLKNKSGQFVQPTLEALSLAAEGLVIPEDFRMSIVDSVHPKSYPVSAFTYILVSDNLAESKLLAFKNFLTWSMGEGQILAPNLKYAKLPDALLAKVKTKIQNLGPSKNASKIK